MNNQTNLRTRDFKSLRREMCRIYCRNRDEEGPIDDSDFEEIQRTISGAAYIDECKLYRYSPDDDWNIQNLNKQILHLSHVGNLNDMFEGIIPSLQQSLSEKEWRILGEFASVKCFSENWDNLLMWAHYANGGRGMCVEYDLALLNGDEPILRYLFPVHYSTQRYIKPVPLDIISEIQELEKVDNNGGKSSNSSWFASMMAYYLIKSREWQYEEEWRIVIPQYVVNEADCRLKIEDNNIRFPCVSAVYLGCKMPDNRKKKIREIVTNMNATCPWHIDVRELSMEGVSYHLKIK